MCIGEDNTQPKNPSLIHTIFSFNSPLCLSFFCLKSYTSLLSPLLILSLILSLIPFSFSFPFSFRIPPRIKLEFLWQLHLSCCWSLPLCRGRRVALCPVCTHSHGAYSTTARAVRLSTLCFQITVIVIIFIIVIIAIVITDLLPAHNYPVLDALKAELVFADCLCV